MYTTMTVSVPVGREAELLRFAATLAEVDPEDAPEIEWEEDEDLEPSARRRWGWGRNSVIESYLGGVSNVWRPFLDYLAERPDEWVPWPELCEHIDRTPQEASGMLGAAERRCNGRPPYEKKKLGGVPHFRMPESVATVIEEIREE